MMDRRQRREQAVKDFQLADLGALRIFANAIGTPQRRKAFMKLACPGGLSLTDALNPQKNAIQPR